MKQMNIKNFSNNIKTRAKKNVRHAKEVANDFEKFAVKGNIIDLAVGVIIGNAFTKIVNSLVNEVIMPLLSIFTNKTDYSNLFLALDGKSYETIELAKSAGVAILNYGSFLTNILDFFIVSLTIFFVLRISVNRIKKKHESKKSEITTEVIPSTKKCPYCLSEIPIEATKCAACTSDLIVK